MIDISTLRSSRFTLPTSIVGLVAIALLSVRTEVPTPFLGHAVMVVGLVPLVVIDLATRRLPRELSYPVAGASAALLVGGELIGDRDLATVAAVGGGAALFVVLLLGLAVASRGGMGSGDVRLAPLLGANLGYHGVVNVPVALFLAAVIALVAAAPRLMRGNSTLKSTVPFGPFLALGTITTLLLFS
jgi:leader peptidase (prepilin peptidase)/N-methyltransferase